MIHNEKTLVVLKPDAVQRVLIGEIIQRFERVGLKIVAMKMVHAKPELIRKHYTIDPEWTRKTGEKKIEALKKQQQAVDEQAPEKYGEEVLDQLERFMTAGPVVAMVLEGAHAVALTRKLVGSTEPLSSDVGTIRGDFVLDSYILADGSERSVRNVIHASSSTDEAEKELSLWFEKGELVSYKTVHERILYDVNFDNVSD